MVKVTQPNGYHRVHWVLYQNQGSHGYQSTSNQKIETTRWFEQRRLNRKNYEIMIKKVTISVRELWVMYKGRGSIPKEGKSWKEVICPKLGIRLCWTRCGCSPLGDTEVRWLAWAWVTFWGSLSSCSRLCKVSRGASACERPGIPALGWGWREGDRQAGLGLQGC